MNGICSLTHYLFANSYIDSIIKALRGLLSVLLNICSTLSKTESYDLFHITQGEHNMVVLLARESFLYSTPRGCQDCHRVVAELKQDKYDSHAQFSILYGNFRESLPVVVP